MISDMSRRLAVAASAAVLGLALASAAVAGPAADRAAEAEALLGQGDAAGALGAFDGAVDAFWGAMPLQIRTAVFAESASAYGKYEPLSGATFHPGDSVTVYLEPAGYGFVSAGGLYRVAFETALEIRTPGGLVLGKSDDFGKLVWSGRAKSREVQLAVSVALPDLKPGKYELALTLTDDATGKSATATMPFAVAE
jgi:hypothetical protein